MLLGIINVIRGDFGGVINVIGGVSLLLGGVNQLLGALLDPIIRGGHPVINGIIRGGHPIIRGIIRPYYYRGSPY